MLPGVGSPAQGPPYGLFRKASRPARCDDGDLKREVPMRVRDIMTTSVETITATDTIGHAARRMAEEDVGVLPVLSDGELIGIVTDRDIAIRGVAKGISAGASIRRLMSEDVAVCLPDDDIETALALMSREQIHRMPVCDEHGKLVGIVGLTDATKFSALKKDVADTLADISVPSGSHCQTRVFA